jgi:hypothetical protein
MRGGIGFAPPPRRPAQSSPNGRERVAWGAAKRNPWRTVKRNPALRRRREDHAKCHSAKGNPPRAPLGRAMVPTQPGVPLTLHPRPPSLGSSRRGEMPVWPPAMPATKGGGLFQRWIGTALGERPWYFSQCIVILCRISKNLVLLRLFLGPTRRKSPKPPGTQSGCGLLGSPACKISSHIRSTSGVLERMHWKK